MARTHDRVTFPLPSTSSLSASPASTTQDQGRTPPPSPSPFMRSFYASLPPPTPSTPPRTLRRIWREHRPHFRRLLLILLLVLLPTLLIAAYFIASTTAAYRASAIAIAVDAPMSGPRPPMHRGGGSLKRRTPALALVPRQANSVDSADAPVLSVGNPLGGGSSTSTTSTSTDGASSNTDTNTGTSGILTATPTTTLRASTTAPSVPSNPVLPTPFVQPFDTTLSTDFLSGSCQAFFSTFSTSLSFRQCRPFSLLLGTSQAFITAQTNLTLLTSILYGTCSTTPSADECTARMNDLSGELRTQCATELSAGHALSWDALNGMKNYAMMRDAGCLRNLRTNAYCFADALAASPPSDVYFYQLPLGTPLPGGTSVITTSSPAATQGDGSGSGNSSKVNVTPTCSACTQSLMGIYARYATNSSLLISQTYGEAQRLVDGTCGSGYASAINAAATSVPVQRSLALGALLSLGMLLLGLGAL